MDVSVLLNHVYQFFIMFIDVAMFTHLGQFN